MLAVIPLPGVNVIPFAQGKSSEVIPIALGSVATRFEVAMPAIVATSLTLPAVEPATVTSILTSLPGLALTTAWAEMFNDVAAATE
jgi:hypothetical protein